MTTSRYTTRMEKAPGTFIREILKVTESPDIISFAGGLPNPVSVLSLPPGLSSMPLFARALLV